MDENKKQAITGPSEEQISQWKAQFGEVYQLTNEDDDSQVFYFRKPDRTHLSHFAKKAMGDTLKALHTLIKDTLLYPSPEVVSKLFAEKPGMVIPLGSELQTIVGTNQDFLSKKL